MKRYAYIVFSILALLCSCEDADDYRYPSVVTDYACLLTDAVGRPELLRLDNGDSHSVAFAKEYLEAHSDRGTYKADTVYRVACVYELTTDDKAYIYSLAQIISVVPTPLNRGEVLHQDPAFLQSSWLSGGYLNMVIEIKALEGKHAIGFVDTTPEGMNGKEFTFYHNANNDIESYRQQIYTSIPLAPFESELQRGDTLRFVINQFDEGLTRREFVM